MRKSIFLKGRGLSPSPIAPTPAQIGAIVTAPYNNLAERMIRPHVILRNRSFQNRSPEGARAHETLMSLLHTLQLQGKDTVALLQKAYLRHRQGNLRPVLSF